jgi:WD40 repeat protein
MKPADIIIQDAHSGGNVVRFNHAGTLLASGGWEGRVTLWRLPDGKTSASWKAHEGSVNGLAFMKNDVNLISAGYDGVLAQWHTDGGLLRRIQTPAPITAMAQDGVQIITGHLDGTVRFWDARSLLLMVEHELHREAVKAVAIASEQGYVASAGADGKVYLIAPYGSPRALQSPPTDAWTLAFSPDGEWLAGGGWFRLFRWSIPDGRLEILTTEHHGIINSVQYSEDGQQLATISRQTDSSVYFVDPQSGVTTQRFQKHDLCGGDIDLSVGGHYLATTSDDSSVRIWVLDKKQAGAEVR